MGFPLWEAATNCTGGPQPGAIALMKWFLAEYGHKGGYNLGIYNCRSVRGASTTSCHGEGRACDFGFPIGDPDGNRVLRRLLKHAGALGIQCIIYERKIYSAKSPKGRPYDGVVPHTDHLHVELTREAAHKLTFTACRRILQRPIHLPGSRDLEEGKRGRDVRFVQRHLGVKADGIYGEDTKKAVRAWEKDHKARYPKLKVDGKVGRLTWRIMNVDVSY